MHIFVKTVAAAILAMTATAAHAASATLTPTADGNVQVFGGDDVTTDLATIDFVQSGGLIRNAILEFDLSAIPDLSTITGASLTFTIARFVSNTGGNPASVDLFAYPGDGIVSILDFDAAGTQVFDGTTPFGGVAGDTRVFAFSDLTPVSDALAGDLLTLRLETDSFASVLFAALENATLDPASLSVTYDAPMAPIPLPAGLPLLLAGLGGLALLRRR